MPLLITEGRSSSIDYATSPIPIFIMLAFGVFHTIYNLVFLINGVIIEKHRYQENDSCDKEHQVQILKKSFQGAADEEDAKQNLKLAQ